MLTAVLVGVRRSALEKGWPGWNCRFPHRCEAQTGTCLEDTVGPAPLSHDPRQSGTEDPGQPGGPQNSRIGISDLPQLSLGARHVPGSGLPRGLGGC